ERRGCPWHLRRAGCRDGALRLEHLGAAGRPGAAAGALWLEPLAVANGAAERLARVRARLHLLGIPCDRSVRDTGAPLTGRRARWRTAHRSARPALPVLPGRNGAPGAGVPGRAREPAVG